MIFSGDRFHHPDPVQVLLDGDFLVRPQIIEIKHLVFDVEVQFLRQEARRSLWMK